MVSNNFDFNRSSSLYTKYKTSVTSPTARPSSIPEFVAQSGPQRNRTSYSNIAYEWSVYRSTGRTLDEYRPLKVFDGYTKKLGGRPIDQSPLRNIIPSVQGPYIEEIRRATSLNTFYKFIPRAFRMHLGDYLTEFIFSNYFYKNVLVYYFVWVNFYVQEYTYPYLVTFFPIFDWLTTLEVFNWPAHIDFYFLRFVFAIFFVPFLLFFFFHFKLRLSSPFELKIAIFNLFIFLFSLFCYFYTGIAPFIFFGCFSAFVFGLYNFGYYIPRLTFSDRLSAAPVLFLPPPVKVPILFLPKYAYRYPFFHVLRSSNISAPPKLVSARYPFSVSTRSLRAWSSHLVFVRSVLAHDYIAVKPRVGFSPAAYHVNDSLPLFGVNLDKHSGFNTYEYFFQSMLENASTVEEEDRESIFFTSVAQHEEEDFSVSPEHVDIPLWINNSAFFSSAFRQQSRSANSSPFSSDFDYFGHGFSPRMPLWQLESINDPYFKLHLWLRHVSPPGAFPTEHSKYYSAFFKDYTEVAPGPLFTPYPLLTAVLRTFYSAISITFLLLTLNNFFPIYTRCTPEQAYFQMIKLTRSLHRLTFFPTFSFYTSSLRFVYFFYRSLHRTKPFRDFFFSDPDVRHETILFMSHFAYRVYRAYANTGGSTLNSRRKRLVLRLLTLYLIRIYVYLIVASPWPEDFANLATFSVG